jgi:hypothetical protein
VDPPEHCPDGSAGLSGTDVHVTVPIDKVDVAMTTQRPFDHPDRTNWFQLTKTCNQDTLGVELHDVDDVHLRQSHWEKDCRDKTQLWINSSQRHDTDVMTEAWDCQDEEVKETRLQIHPLPTKFTLRTPVPTMNTDKGAVFTSDGHIDKFQYTSQGCDLITEEYEPNYREQQVLTVKTGLQWAGNTGGCAAASGFAKAGGLIATGLDEAKKLAVKASDGNNHYVVGTTYRLDGPLEQAWDLDGFSDQNDRPRFHRLTGTFANHELEIQDTEQDRALDWSLDEVADATKSDERITMNLQGQWYDTGTLTPSDTLVPGTLDVPNSLISPDEKETETDAKRQAAANLLEDRINVKTEGDWETIPARAWTETLE